MRRVLILLIVMSLFSVSLYSRTDRNFDKMISYYILEDIKMAKIEYDIFFKKYSDAQLKLSFSLLLNNKVEEANEQFFSYLQMKPRSIEGLIGYSLSDSSKVKSTILNLKKAVRLDPTSSIALLCIAHEYYKKLNYPQSEFYYNTSNKIRSTIELKIIWSFLYLKRNMPDKIIDLLEKEFDVNQANFYVNYLLASAYYLKNDLNAMVKHMDLLNGVGENKKKGDLILAKYYIRKRDFKRAKSILFQIKHKEVNEDYDTALAITMMNLNSNKSLYYLYKVLKQNKWSKEINRQLGIYFYKRDKKKLVQNFIYRSILAGIPTSSLKQYFSGIEFEIPDYQTMNFFQLFNIKWIDDNILAVFAKIKSGERSKVYIIDTKKNVIVRSLNLPATEKGKFSEAFRSRRGNIVFSFFSPETDLMSIYHLSKIRNSYKLGKIISINSYMHEYLIKPSIKVGFDNSGTVAYITDGGIDTVAFNSPFLVKWSLTNTKPAYPKYPFDIVKYDFKTNEAFKIINTNQMKLTPINAVSKYFLMNQAYIGNSGIKDYIIKGQKMDIISSEKIITFFDKNINSFLIYLKGSEDSFKAIIFKNDNSSKNISETMFLGEKIFNETIDLKLIRLDSDKKNIIIMRKDTNQLILFNFETLLYSYLNRNVRQLYYSKEDDLFYSIVIKGSVNGYNNTSTCVFTVDPYLKIMEYDRTDIEEISKTEENGEILFYTRNEEKYKINDSEKLEYIGPSFKNIIHSKSDNGQKNAIFINNRLIIINKKLNKRRIVKK